MDNSNKLYNMHKGETAFILAGGASLRTQKLERLYDNSNNLVITVNDAWRLVPASFMGIGVAHYFGDAKWWQRQLSVNPRSLDLRTFQTENVPLSFHDVIYHPNWYTGCSDFKDHPQVRYLKLTGERGLETDPLALRHGSNSGYAAINLAVHAGVSKIILLGFDMNVSPEGATHWHADSEYSAPFFDSVMHNAMLPCFETLVEPLREKGVEVINASPDSDLKCFPRMTLVEALEEPLGEY